MLRRFGKDPDSVQLYPERLDKPLRRKKPTRFFVGSLGDFFHEDIPKAYQADMFSKMLSCELRGRGHTFIILTKRPSLDCRAFFGFESNIWFGMTAWDQASYEAAMPQLQQNTAAVRFLSFEPLLGPVDMRTVPTHGLKWVIVGGENGPKARPMHPDWVRAIRDYCVANRIPFWFKGYGEWVPAIGGPPVPQSRIRRLGDESVCMVRYGRKLTGRTLDGREWNELPMLERS